MQGLILKNVESAGLMIFLS